jgi:hypothetical protein
MKLKQIQEARYQDAKPEFTNLSDEKVIQTFFDEDLEQSEEYAEYPHDDEQHGTRVFYVKEGLIVHDNRMNEVINNVHLRNNKWTTVDFDHEQEWPVQPSKFRVDMMQPVYRER